MPRGIAIAAPRSGSGKTIFTMALMDFIHRHSKRIRPFKVGPDYIDPLFHRTITGEASINLDTFLMNSEQVRYLYRHYTKPDRIDSHEERIAVMEGVMGFYDGVDRGSSTYDVTRTLGIPVVLILPANGVSQTLSALLFGLLNYRKDHTIRAVVLNHIGSESHYALLKKTIQSDFPDISVAGWIPSNLDALSSRHLGLHTAELERKNYQEIAVKILANVDLDLLAEIWSQPHEIPGSVGPSATETNEEPYPFPVLYPEEVTRLKTEKLTIVKDRAFSFLYADNIAYLESLFGSVTFVSAMDDQEIPEDTNVVYLPGGYVETSDVYPSLHRATRFRESLVAHVRRGRRVYGECAGLLYLGETVYSETDEAMEMSRILPLEFRMRNRRKRLGYYESKSIRGHSFHYSEPILPPVLLPSGNLTRPGMEEGEAGVWELGKIAGTYLHTMFRNQPEVIRQFFLD